MKLKVCNEDGYSYFFCPACNHIHALNVGPKGWEYNGNPDSPVTNPSIRVSRCDHGDLNNGVTLCHCYLEGDLIRYCDDSPHEFAGQRVPLPEIPEKYL